MITLFSPKIQGWWCLYYISCAWLFQLVTINMFDSYLRLAKETYHRLKHVFQQVPQFPWTKLLYTCPLCILLSVLLCNRKYFLVCLCDIIPSFLSKTTIIRWPFSLHPSLRYLKWETLLCMTSSKSSSCVVRFVICMAPSKAFSACSCSKL